MRAELALGDGAPHAPWSETLHRDGAPAATTTHLADALRALDLPDGPGQAWGAAESRIARDLRTVLRDERGLPRSRAGARGRPARNAASAALKSDGGLAK